MTAFALSAPVASAADRYAVPGGFTAGPCNPFPCTIERAIEDVAVGGVDTVHLAAGLYQTGVDITDTITLAKNLDVIGAGVGQTVISSSASPAFVLDLAALGTPTVNRLTINHSGSGEGLRIETGQIDKVAVTSTGSSACHALGDPTLLNTACVHTTTNGDALLAQNSGFNATLVLRHVTVHKPSGTGGAIYLLSSGQDFTVDAANTIAHAPAPGVADVFGQTPSMAGDAIVANFQYSSYADSGSGPPDLGTVTITTPGSMTNISGLPLLAADAFHQLPGSPTIDTGSNTFSTVLDIDIENRPNPATAIADIGADEFYPAPVQPVTPTTPPTVSTPTGLRAAALKKCKKKRSKKRKKCRKRAKRLPV